MLFRLFVCLFGTWMKGRALLGKYFTTCKTYVLEDVSFLPF